MANDISRNPWRIDTPATGVNVWLSAVIPGVIHFEFVGYTVAASKAVINDLDGKLICQLSGASDLEEVRSGRIGNLHRGICLDGSSVLNSGIVLVFVK